MQHPRDIAKSNDSKGIEFAPTVSSNTIISASSENLFFKTLLAPSLGPIAYTKEKMGWI